jgi:hypothetical protein
MISAVPAGLADAPGPNPAMNRWAIFLQLGGLEFSHALFCFC